MRKGRLLFPLLGLLLITACAPPPPQDLGEGVFLRPLGGEVWLHESWIDTPQWGRVSANGLILRRGKEALLIDTPWTEEQTRVLVEAFETQERCRVEAAVVCHFHSDNMGGLGWLQKRGIPSYASERTRRICRDRGLSLPDFPLGDDEERTLGGRRIVAFFPGAAHSRDNICVYLPDRRLLFGSCPVKSQESRSLGNTADAVLESWPSSLRRLKDRFPQAEQVVPGHGSPGGPELLTHTLSLLEEAAREKGGS